MPFNTMIQHLIPSRIWIIRINFYQDMVIGSMPHRIAIGIYWHDIDEEIQQLARKIYI